MLLDHFHPPLKGRRHWTGFHSRWAGNLAADLNRRLPEGWFAEPTVHWGIEVDVATFEEAVVAGTTDVVEVQVFHDFGDLPLVGVIGLVSPANKDRPETREAFLSKCETYLRDAVGLVMVDVVTSLRGSLHSLLMQRCDASDLPDDALYASAYHPVQHEAHGELDIWYETLQVGGTLPAMPLFLKNGPRIRVSLAETYRLTCDELRIPRVAGD